MKINSKIFFTFLLIIYITFFNSCRKEISVPNPELNKLFGSWQWISSFCGWGGLTNASSDKTIEFNKNGIYKEYTNGEETKKCKFSLIEKEYDSCTMTTFFIDFKDTGLFKNKNENYEGTIKFFGNDTLVLSSTSFCFDGCEYTYVRI